MKKLTEPLTAATEMKVLQNEIENLKQKIHDLENDNNGLPDEHRPKQKMKNATEKGPRQEKAD